MTQTRDEQREEELERLFRAHSAELTRQLSRLLRNDARAQEIAQETYMLFWRTYRTAAEPIRDPRGFIFAVGVRMAINELTRQKTHARLAEKIAPIDTTIQLSLSPESEALLAESMYKLEHALEKLRPPILREVWILRNVHDLAPAEICARLGISMSAYEQRLTAANGQLASLLTALGVGPRASD